MLAVIEDRNRREDIEEEDEEDDWDEIAKSVPGKTPVQCLRRYMSKLNKKEEAGPHPPTPVAAGTRRTRSARDKEESDEESHAAKKAKTDSSEDGWQEDEIELLKKLVEHYSDSKCLLYVNRDFTPCLDNSSNLYAFYINDSLSSMERHCSQLP